MRTSRSTCKRKRHVRFSFDRRLGSVHDAGMQITGADGEPRVKFNVYLRGEAARQWLALKDAQVGAKDGTLAAALIGEAIAARGVTTKGRRR